MAFHLQVTPIAPALASRLSTPTTRSSRLPQRSTGKFAVDRHRSACSTFPNSFFIHFFTRRLPLPNSAFTSRRAIYEPPAHEKSRLMFDLCFPCGWGALEPSPQGDQCVQQAGSCRILMTILLLVLVSELIAMALRKRIICKKRCRKPPRGGGTLNSAECSRETRPEGGGGTGFRSRRARRRSGAVPPRVPRLWGLDRSKRPWFGPEASASWHRSDHDR